MGLVTLVVHLVSRSAGVNVGELLLKVPRAKGFEVRTDLFLGSSVGLFLGPTKVFQLLDEDTIVVIVGAVVPFVVLSVRRLLAGAL